MTKTVSLTKVWRVNGHPLARVPGSDLAAALTYAEEGHDWRMFNAIMEEFDRRADGEMYRDSELYLLDPEG
jgi:hypothetical protein